MRQRALKGVIDHGSGVKSTRSPAASRRPPYWLDKLRWLTTKVAAAPRVAAGFKYPTFVRTRRRGLQNQRRRKWTKFQDVVEIPDNAVAV
jgi:hypothetical protein